MKLDGLNNRQPRLVPIGWLAAPIVFMLLWLCPKIVSGQQIPSQTLPDQSLPLLQNLKSRNDELGFDSFVDRSTIEAEQFRRSLLTDSKLPATTLGVACVSFRDSDAVRNFTLESSYDLSRFQLGHLQIRDAIAGIRDVPDPGQFYGSFAGKWFGRWTENDVDHQWGDYVVLDQPRILEPDDREPVTLIGYQYAWVGDGYGLNHLASTGNGKHKFLLGYVVHIRDQDPGKEVARRPHVGVIDGPGRVIWMTRGEVFFEEMVRGKTSADDRYFITGFRYSIKDKVLSTSQAFQTVYSRNPDNRQPWRGSSIKWTVSPPLNQK